MKTREMREDCVVLATVAGGVAALGHVSVAGVATLIRAVAARHMCPSWAASRLLAGTPNGVHVLVQWIFPGHEARVGVVMVKEGGEIRVVSGGLGADPWSEDLGDPSGDELSGTVSACATTVVEYGPQQILRWLAEAAMGPETVGETEPLKPVPGDPCNGACGPHVGEYGDGVETKVNPWR